MTEETKEELGAELADEDRRAGSPNLSGTPRRENFIELYGSDGSAGATEPTTPTTGSVSGSDVTSEPAGQTEPTTGSAPSSEPTTGSAPATPST